MLDQKVIDYIFDNYSHFLSLREWAAMKHHITLSKHPDALVNSEKLRLFVEKSWISQDGEVLKLLGNGYQKFREDTAERILKERRGSIHLNTCPKCGCLARTPNAKQCRFCHYDWHSHAKVIFRISAAFEISLRNKLFVLGDVKSGEVKVGMRMDLTVLGFKTKPRISAIEYARQSSDGRTFESIGLELEDLSDYEKEYLRTAGPFSMYVPIEEQNGG